MFLKSLLPPLPNPRQVAVGAVRRYLLERPPSPSPETPPMARPRDRILANLDDMYRDAFDRAKAAQDEAQMASLDFAYRREQLYFEILLDIRDAVERR